MISTQLQAISICHSLSFLGEKLYAQSEVTENIPNILTHITFMTDCILEIHQSLNLETNHQLVEDLKVSYDLLKISLPQKNLDLIKCNIKVILKMWVSKTIPHIIQQIQRSKSTLEIFQPSGLIVSSLNQPS